MTHDPAPPAGQAPTGKAPTGKEPRGKAPTGKALPDSRRFWPLALIGAALIGVFASGLHRQISLEGLVTSRASVEAWLAAHPVLGPGAFLAVYIALVALSVPGSAVMTLAAGFFFGPFTGSALAIIGAGIGAVLVFLAARSVFRDVFARKAGGLVARFAAGLRANEASYLLFLRFVPVFPFWLVNLAPALVGVKLRTYAWTTLVGILPGTVAFAMVGAGLDGVLAGPGKVFRECLAAGHGDCRLSVSPADLVTRELVIGLCLLGAIALVPVLWKRLRANEKGST